MLKFAVNISILLKEVPFLDRFASAAELGFGAVVFWWPGAALVLQAVRFEQRLAGASLVFTAEGRLDEQTAYGKSVGAVAAAARRRGIPVVVLAGGLAPGYERLYAAGVGAVLTLPDGPLAVEESMARAGELVRGAAERALRLILLGMHLGAATPPAA